MRVIKRCLAVLMIFLTIIPAADAYELQRGGVLVRYESDTLKFVMRRYVLNTQACHVIEIELADPARQIRKAMSPWHEELADVIDMAAEIPGVMLAVNGSGYVSPVYPEIPDTYPGSSADYWYEPLGSLTVTDGKTLRCLKGIPFYGLTLQEDGLHMHVGEDPEKVLEAGPLQTWSFYEECPLIRDGEIILDTEWPFANHRAKRNVIAETEDGHILLFLVMDRPGVKLTDLTECLHKDFRVRWAYNLDGGPSAALVRRRGNRLHLVGGAGQKVVDIIGFTE